MSVSQLAASLHAAEGGALKSFEEKVDSVFKPITKFASDIVFYPVNINGTDRPIVVFWLVLAGLICTFLFKGVQLRHFGLALQVAKGKFSRSQDPGQITHFQALTSAVSGTVGLGNIAGVGVAVTIGGPGATFWMVCAGLLGMATKFAECTLGVKYRKVNADGSVEGGPFRYLPVAFAKLGRIPAKILTGAFAVAIILFGLAGGNMFQANQTFAQAKNVTGGESGFLGSDGAALIFGLILAALVAAVILGGVESIGNVTSKLVPAMAGLYILACLTVIAFNATSVFPAFGSIISGAFSSSGVQGGFIGVLIVGFQRAAFSNEAGLGSSPIVHSAVKTRRPVSEGFVASLEPFIDTVIVCTMTALTIVIAEPKAWVDGQAAVANGKPAPDGVVVTSEAFKTVVDWFPNVLALAVTLFAFSTLLTWSYYGLRAWTTLIGRSPAKEMSYKIIFCVFTVIGTILNFGQVLDFADAMLFLCAFINLSGVYILLPVVRRELKSYLAERKAGTLLDDPPTSVDKVPDWATA
ncbi:alanine/glycine:cation symporter family protein [Dermatophilaceae bacterium Sec6.4]|nr:alanine:cation symporter family protein [Actinomycetota bacterium]